MYLCDFHREQAWERWCRKSENGLQLGEKEKVLSLLRNIANSKKGPPGRESQHFDEAVKQMRSNAIYNSNSKLQRWVESTWLSCHKRWVYAYREEKYNICLNTNNGVESQNKLFKQIYLPRAAERSLSSIASVIINNFLADQYKQYIIKTIKMNVAHKYYNNSIPKFLHGRPQKFVKHCLSRISNADDLEGHVVPQDLKNMIFKVKSSDGSHEYSVQIHKPYCGCPDWRRFRLPCKHMFDIFKWVDGIDWYTLPESYLCAPYISADNDSLSNFQRTVHTTQTTCTINDATESTEEPELDDTSDKVTTLPIKEKTSLKSLAIKARTALKSLQDLTYLSKDKDAMKRIADTATSLEKELKGTIPDESGLLVRTSPLKKKKKPQPKKKCKQKNTGLEKIGCLKKYQPPAKKQKHWRHRNRVGEKADMLRKTYNVHVTINSPENTLSKNPCDSDSDDSLLTSIFDDLRSFVQCPAPPNPSSPLTLTSASPTYHFFNMSSQLPAHPSTSLPSPSPAQPWTSLQSPAQPSTSVQSPAQPLTSLQSPAQPSTSLQSSAQPCISLTSPTCSKPSITDDSDDEETTVLVTSPTSSSWRSKFSDLITKEELKCLQEGEKLNDLIIDASLK